MRAFCFALALAGCSSSLAPAPDLSSDPDLSQGQPDLTPSQADLAESPDALVRGDSGLTKDRPYHFYVPAGYDAQKPTPLVILLHGYTSYGEEQDLYWQLKPVAESKTFLYAYPDGTIDFLNNHFWNATDACCDIGLTGVDDVAYLNAIIDDVSAKYNVDEKRIFVTGHSNGGFMSHRMACDAPRVAAIASLAGAVWNDASKCNPAGKVAVLQIHGDMDEVINYNGGSNQGLGTYPSAHQTVGTWAAKNGCSGVLTDSGQTLDLFSTIAGSETVVEKYAGCPAHGEVELWTIKTGTHVPLGLTGFSEALYGFLSAHPKP